MTRLLIMGGGGHGAVVADAAAESDRWSDIVFLDDDTSIKQVLDYSVAGPLSEFRSFLDSRTEVVVAIGNNRRRLELLELVGQSGGNITTIMHPSAIVSRSADISAGTVIFAGSIIGPGTKVGAGCILNTGATVDHDCVIEDGVHISPGANIAGGVEIGACTWIGIGSSVRELINIGSDSIVGAGAAVVSDVESGNTVVGVPARPVVTSC